jgi:hypothetical protein
MIEAARTPETSVDNYFTRQYIPEDKSELQNLCCRYGATSIAISKLLPVDIGESPFLYARICGHLVVK